ncbi:hypothetical protein F2Q70_00009214 [Brassica cretica]|uniref:Uncharacterized protein n=1 Tax=Brassica cretica TaxID=69181 RepID=A0A8S9LZP2_BRACR|nr:hypothetical protein F2Q70_00009214 [Brassica cretica]
MFSGRREEREKMNTDAIYFSITNITGFQAEKRKKQEAEHKAKLDEIAEKQRQRERELEEKEKKRREELLKGTDAPPARPAEPTAAPAAAAPPAAAPAQASGKYVPRFKRQTAEVSAPAQTPPAADSDRWGNRGPPPADDHWGSNRGGPSQKPDRWVPGSRGSDRPSGGDAWRSGEERRSPFGSSRPRPAQR